MSFALGSLYLGCIDISQNVTWVEDRLGTPQACEIAFSGTTTTNEVVTQKCSFELRKFATSLDKCKFNNFGDLVTVQLAFDASQLVPPETIVMIDDISIIIFFDDKLL